ncbi:MAG: DUF4363 family protein [Patescibacteria group bacterium]
MRLPLVIAAVLVVFLVLALVVEDRMSAAASRLTADLARAERETREGSYRAALSSLHRFARRWQKLETTWAFVTDHYEIDQVKIAIERANRLLQAHSRPEALAELASLHFLVDHIPKKESFRIKSVL